MIQGRWIDSITQARLYLMVRPLLSDGDHLHPLREVMTVESAEKYSDAVDDRLPVFEATD